MEFSMDGFFSLLQVVGCRALRTSAWIGGLVIAAGAAPVALADEPVPAVQADNGSRTSEIQAWIEQLGDPSFTQREEASKQLLSIGEPPWNCCGAQNHILQLK